MATFECPCCRAKLVVNAVQTTMQPAPGPRVDPPPDITVDQVHELWLELKPQVEGVPMDREMPGRLLSDIIALLRKVEALAHTSSDARLTRIRRWAYEQKLPSSYAASIPSNPEAAVAQWEILRASDAPPLASCIALMRGVDKMADSDPRMREIQQWAHDNHLPTQYRPND